MSIWTAGNVVVGWLIFVAYKISEAIIFVLWHIFEWIIKPFHRYINLAIYIYVIIPLGRLLRWFYRLMRTAVEITADFIWKVAQKIGHFLKVVAQKIGQILKVIFTALSSFLSKAGRVIFNVASTVFNWIVKAGRETGNFLWKWIKPVLDFIID